MAQAQRFRGRLLSTAGIEYETCFLRSSDVITALKSTYPSLPDTDGTPISSLTRDSSIESMVATGAGYSLFLGSDIMRRCTTATRSYKVDTYGIEIVSRPQTEEQMHEYLYTLLPALSNAGEVFSPRSSFHIHIGFPLMLESLKSALALAIKFEGLFYRLAGMGQNYRGEINRSIYARPVSLPVAVRSSEGDHLLMLPSLALNASDVDEFFAYYWAGKTPSSRYTPARYFGVNLYSVSLIGTLEFRFFNSCTNAAWVEAVTKLCRMFAQIAAFSDSSEILCLQGIDIQAHNDISTYVAAIEALRGMAERAQTETRLGSRDLNALMDIMRQTPPYEFSSELVRTHVKDLVMRPSNVKNFTGGRTADKVVESGHIDGHNFMEVETHICVS